MDSLSVKYRPTTFEEVIGETNTVRILKKQVETKNYKNSYLFSGPSGTGKTTLARILAYKMNEYVDSNGNLCTSEPIEVDAASNNGVDNIRNIIEGAYNRSLDGKYKIYVVDECHMLTAQSWNALLKTIEETPKYTVFMFCTTEYHKVPNTIKNRCQQYFLSRVPDNLIVNRLKYISDNEGLTYTQEALKQLAKLSGGSVRQAIAYLENCSDYSNDISVENVISVLGKFSYDTFFELINGIIDKNHQVVVNTVEDVYLSGTDLKLFIENFLDFVLDMSKFTIFNSFDIIKIPETMKEKLLYTVNVESPTKYFNHILDKLLDLKQMIKNDSNAKNTVEAYLLQL